MQLNRLSQRLKPRRTKPLNRLLPRYQSRHPLASRQLGPAVRGPVTIPSQRLRVWPGLRRPNLRLNPHPSRVCPRLSPALDRVITPLLLRKACPNVQNAVDVAANGPVGRVLLRGEVSVLVVELAPARVAPRQGPARQVAVTPVPVLLRQVLARVLLRRSVPARRRVPVVGLTGLHPI